MALELVIATHNLHKLREFKELLKTIPRFDLLTLHHFPEYNLPAETGKTLKENALIKARHAAQHLNKYVLADDSGLIVPALNGEPGILSRRYAGEHATDAENRKTLLKKMQGLTEDQRHAYFECCLVLCCPAGKEKVVTGTCEGYILSEERGGGGFGYDSLFVKHDYEKTFAELPEHTKNRISHRYKAFEKLMVTLETLSGC